MTSLAGRIPVPFVPDTHVSFVNQSINILTFNPKQMKKLLYSLMGCAALLTVGTATGRDALAQVYTNITAPADEGTTTGEYLKPDQVVDLMINFIPDQDNVKLAFTSPRIGIWSISGDYEQIAMVDAIRIYRNEGLYYDEENRELLHEFKNVASGTDVEWTDETKLEHGKYWYYMIIPVIDGYEGQSAGRSAFVGWRIDPATDFSVVPGDKGAIEATISFNAPTTADDGAVQVNEPFKIELTRKDDSYYSSHEVIHTFENVEPGTPIEYVDKDEETLKPGTVYTYRLSIYYDGSTTTSTVDNQAKVLIGPDKPAAPSNLVVVAEGDNVKLTWDAPTKGQNNGWFDPSTVRYNVERGPWSSWPNYTLVAEGIENTEFVDNLIPEEGVWKYRVTACIGDAEGDYVESSEKITAGPLPKMPWKESWPNASSRYKTWNCTGDWNSSTGTTIYDSTQADNPILCEIDPVDEDGGMLHLRSYKWSHEAGDKESATTGRIDFSEAVNPILKFCYFDLDPAYTDNVMKVYASADGGEFVELEDLDFQSGAGLNKWITLTTSLAQFVGAQYINVKFEATLGEMFAQMAIDAVEVRELMPIDLVVKSANLPAKFYPGAKMNASVTIENTGDNDTEPFAAMVTLDGEDLAYAECLTVKSQSATVMQIPVEIPADIEGGIHTIKIDVEGGYEQNMDNNSASVDVEIVALPAPSNLTSSLKVLTWEAADELPFSDGDKLVRELFADYEHGATGTFGDWTFVDVDGLTTYNIPGAELDYPNKNTAISGMVLSPSLLGASWDTPEKGGQCFIFIGCSGYADDWLISPELNGMAQTVTFKAAGAASSWSELFEVMASSVDKETTSFVRLSSHKIPGNGAEEWTEYTVDLPVGTKYFAIHCVSNFGDALCVTDFNFTTGYGLTSEETKFLGYNVYFGDEKVNPELITETTYTLPEDASNGVYAVKAAYNNAESAPTEGVFVQVSGLDSVNAEGKLLSVEGTTLVISGTGAYAVVDLAGRTVAAGQGAARVAAAPGTYVVTVDGTVFKVVLK